MFNFKLILHFVLVFLGFFCFFFFFFFFFFFCFCLFCFCFCPCFFVFVFCFLFVCLFVCLFVFVCFLPLPPVVCLCYLYLCLSAYSGVQNILCCDLSCLSSSCVPYVVNFSGLSICDCPSVFPNVYLQN